MNNKVISLIHSALLVLSVSVLTACSESDLDHLAKAKSAIDDNRMREAVISLKNTLKANPDNAEGRYLLGNIQLIAGDVASAEKELKRSAELGWNDQQVTVNLARALLLQAKYEEVAALGAADDWPADARANLQALKSIATAAGGDMDAAREELAKAEDLDGEALYVLKTRAQFLLLDGKSGEVVELLGKASTLYPENGELKILNAKALLIEGDVDAAEELYRAIIESEPKNLITSIGREAHLELARLNIINHEDDEAKKSIDYVRSYLPNDPAMNYLSAVLEFREKKYDEAEISLRKILKVSPEHLQTQLLFGAVSFASGKYEQSTYYLGRYILARPDDIKARKILGQAYLALEQHDKARSTLEDAVTARPDDAELMALAGLSSLYGGNTGAGISELERAVSMAPESAAIRSELAKAYMSEGDADQAVEQLEKIIKGGEGAYRAQIMVVLAYSNQRKFDKAIAEVQKMIDKYPGDATVTSLMWVVQLASGDTEAGRRYFEQALQIDPANTGAGMYLASLDENEGKFGEARSRYMKVLEVNKGNANVMLSLARLAYKKGDIDEQVEWLQKVRETDKKDVRARVALAEHYLNERDFAAADEIIKEMEENEAEAPIVMIVRAEYLMARESYNQAGILINKIIDKQPGLHTGHYLKGLNLLKLDDIAGAKTSLLKANEINPNDLKTLVLLSRISFVEEDYEKALELGESMRKIAPARAVGFIVSGDAYARTGDDVEAMAAYDSAWELEQTGEIVLKSSAIKRKYGDRKAAYALLRSWLDGHPDDNVVRFKLAEASQIDGDTDTAVREYETILSNNPDDIVVLNNLSWIYNELGDSKALEYARKAHGLNDSPAIKDTYGWVLLSNGQIDKALTVLEQASEQLPDEAEISYHLAVAYHRKGDKQKAYEILEALIASNKRFDSRDDAKRLLEEQ